MGADGNDEAQTVEEITGAEAVDATQTVDGGTAASSQSSKDVLANTNADAAHGSVDFEAAIAERDNRIAELEAQIASAAQSAETAEALQAKIDELKEQSASERVDFQLQLAGCRNTKAARAVLDDYDGDIEALKAAESWLFESATPSSAAATGATGLPNAGTATDESATLKRWREIAGLTEDDGR